MQTTTEVLIWTILGSLLTLVAFILFINHVLTLFNKKSIEFDSQLRFTELEKEKEILKTQINVKEETIQKISKELHDNIIQLLTLSKLNLNNTQIDDTLSKKFDVSKELITKAIGELTNLSRSLSSESIMEIGLLRTLELEKERVFQINGTHIKLDTDFDTSTSTPEEQLILYRIFQESLRNSITHGKSSEINITLSNNNNQLIFEISDNGIGFDTHKIKNDNNRIHQGISNIKNRVLLINATCKIISNKENGTKILIKRSL